MNRDIDRKVQIRILDPRVHKENDNLVKNIETILYEKDRCRKLLSRIGSFFVFGVAFNNPLSPFSH